MSKINSMNYTPVAGYLLLEPTESEQLKGLETFGVEGKPQFAKVLKVGKPTRYQYSDRLFPSPCKVGDVIIHSSMGYEDIEFEGKKYRMLPFSKVLLVKK